MGKRKLDKIASRLLTNVITVVEFLGEAGEIQ